MNEEQDGPVAEWRTVSLVTCLRQALLERAAGGRRPSKARHTDPARLAEVTDELTARGIDGDALVRYGIVSEVALRTLIDLVLDELFPIDRESQDINAVWRTIFQLDHPAVKEKISKLPQDPEAVYESIRGLLAGHGAGPVTVAFARVICWATNVADLDALLKLSAPSQEVVAGVPVTAPDEEMMRAYRWIVDRFSSTYYSEWATESLHSEWRWQRGIGAPPCPVDLTVEPPIRMDVLEHQIASRAVLSAPSVSSIVATPLAHQVAPHARALLSDGKVEQAAALFEFACKQDPDNPDLRNNLGFCLIPSAPRLALGHLDAASRLGYAPLAINVYNKMCCYVSMDRPVLAVRESDKFFADSVSDAAVVPAVVWSITADREHVLTSTDDVRKNARTLAAFAQTLHDKRFPDTSSREEAGKRLPDN